MSRITISGTIGSGKSSTGKALAAKLGYEFLSGGQIFRKQARDLGMTLEAFEKKAELDPVFDRKQNDVLVEYLKKNDDTVMESRLSAFLAIQSGIDCFRVFLDADEDTRITRFSGREHIGLEESRSMIREREKSDSERFMDFFGVDHRDPQLYNVIIDTTRLSVKEAAEQIYERFRAWKPNERISGN